ncbi:MAG: CPBP family glutamic-type intramembrane protease [Promethearchaeota archaeon]|jgi:membrane protease YdiL (CAAX protease family)
MVVNIEMSKMDIKLRRSLLSFFGLVFLISIPIWIISAITAPFIPEGLPVNNIGFILVFTPIIVALILTYKTSGKESAKKLLKRAFDIKLIDNKLWYLPILFLVPIVAFLSLGLMVLLGMGYLENSISFVAIPILFFIFIIFSIAEQVGWQGYAYDIMETKWGSLRSAFLLGMIWAIWHIPLWLIINLPGGILSIIGQCFYTVALRVLIVWIYNKANKSVFTAVIIHAISNICTMVLPIFSTPLGPMIVSILMTCVLTISIIVLGFEK